MLRVKKEFRNKTVELRSEGRSYMFNGSKDYNQEQLKSFSNTPAFAKLIEDDKDVKEVNVKDIKKEEVQPSMSYPIFDLEKLESMNLGDLRKTYPFVKNTSKNGFIEDLIDLNFGN